MNIKKANQIIQKLELFIFGNKFFEIRYKNNPNKVNLIFKSNFNKENFLVYQNNKIKASFRNLNTKKKMEDYCLQRQKFFNDKIGLNKQIIIIASPNVQDNFRLQLFDERKLKFENEMWNMNSCVGNQLLNEINPYKIS